MRLRAYYWIVPAMAAIWWFICLIGLLGLWAANGHNHFSGTAVVDGVRRIKYTDSVYISDIGAEHQHFFIVFCCLTAAFYIATVFIERYLRHQRHIPGSLHKRTSWFDSVSLVCACLGSFGLIMLSIFNTFDHGGIHWSMTALFIVGALLSVLFQTIMLFDLSKSHDHVAKAAKQLLYPALVKCAIFALAIMIAIAFGSLYMTCRGEKFFLKGEKCNTIISAAAGCEWSIAFLLVIYLFCYVYDFWPARKDRETVQAEGWAAKPSKKAKDSGFGSPYIADSRYYATQPSVEYLPGTPAQEKFAMVDTGLHPTRYGGYSPRTEGSSETINMPGDGYYTKQTSPESTPRTQSLRQLLKPGLSTTSLTLEH